jgi:hypothetical protein
MYAQSIRSSTVRWFLLALLLIVLGGAVGFLALGAFPPEPHPNGVHKVIANDRVGHTSP